MLRRARACLRSLSRKCFRCLLRRLFINLDAGEGGPGRQEAEPYVQDGADKSLEPVAHENKDWISVDLPEEVLEGGEERCQQQSLQQAGLGLSREEVWPGEYVSDLSGPSQEQGPSRLQQDSVVVVEQQQAGTLGQEEHTESGSGGVLELQGVNQDEPTSEGSSGDMHESDMCDVALKEGSVVGRCVCTNISGEGRTKVEDQEVDKGGKVSLEVETRANYLAGGLALSASEEAVLALACSGSNKNEENKQIEGGTSGFEDIRNGEYASCKIPEQFQNWPVMRRLQGLARRNLTAPFRICVKGLGGPVRQKIRATALLAGFDSVNETKEKNMWLGNVNQGDSQQLEKSVLNKLGPARPQRPSDAEIADLRNMSKSEFMAMDIQVHQAIKAYLSVWMADVSKTFGKSETCCTSLEIDCFLMEREWVYRQAMDLAAHCGLTAVPAANGHLKIQKGTTTSLHGPRKGLSLLEASLQSQSCRFENSSDGPEEGIQRDRVTLSNSLVVQRLQECYKARQKEHLFILEVSRNDIRQILTKLAKLVGFTATKITAKGKFVATKGKSAGKSPCVNDISMDDVCTRDMEELEAHVQRGIRSYIFSWFSTFEKVNYAQKSLPTSSFLMPASWVQDIVQVLAESVGAVCEMKHPGILDVGRRQQSGRQPELGITDHLKRVAGNATDVGECGRLERCSKSEDMERVLLHAKQSQASELSTCSVPAPKSAKADQVAVWNQLKFLYKQKQGAHLVWAEGLEKHTKETICEAGLKLGFTSAQDLGSYVRLSRFDSSNTWTGSSSQENTGVCGCKLGKLAENLRRRVVSLDAVVIPAVTGHITETLKDLNSSVKDEIKVEVESYPLPEFWVARIVEDAAKKFNQQTRRIEGLKSVLVSKVALPTDNSCVSAEGSDGQATSVVAVLSDASRQWQSASGSPKEHGWSIALPTQRPVTVYEEAISTESPSMSCETPNSERLGLPPGASALGPLRAYNAPMLQPAKDQIAQVPQFDESLQEVYAGMSAPYFPAAFSHERSPHSPRSRDWTQAQPFCPFGKSTHGNRALPLKSPRNRGLPFTSPFTSTLPSEQRGALLCTPGSLLLPLEDFRASLCSPRLSDDPGMTLHGLTNQRPLHSEQWKDEGDYWTSSPSLECGRRFYPKVRTSPLATLPLRATVHYVKTQDHMDFWCNFITSSNVNVMGIDTEWKPNFGPADNNTVALIQICFKVATIRDPKVPMYICVLFHVHHSSVTAAFVSLLENYSIVKVGVQIDVDIAKVRRDHLIEMNNCVELYSEASSRGFHARGLKGLVAAVLDRDLPKNKTITLSNWEDSPLSLEQEQYAAYDAYAALRVFEELHGVEATSLPL